MLGPDKRGVVGLTIVVVLTNALSGESVRQRHGGWMKERHYDND